MTELQTMPLRFRVWDKEGKKFCIPSRHSDGYELVYVNDGDYGYSIDLAGGMAAKLGDNAIISQDTGLVDKNGNSIFTGDIVKLPDWVEGDKYETVRYSLSCAGVAPFVRGCVECDEPRASECEVIGNIWEGTNEQD